MKNYILICLIILGLIACKGMSKQESSVYNSPTITKKTKEIDISRTSDETNLEEGTKDGDINKAEGSNSKDTKPVDIRKIIKEGSISYQVRELDNIEKNIKDNVDKFNGYMASVNYYSNSLNMELKIPIEKFDEFLIVAEKFGKITNKSIKATDVTMQYFDLDGRVKNKKIHQARLRGYLATAKTVQELIQVENELARITEDLESLEGQFKTMSNQISFSTLSLQFNLPYNNEIIRTLPSIKKGFMDLLYFIIYFLYVLFFIILYTVVIGTPLIFLVGIIYYFTFGKIGLVKKFFKLLSNKKQT